jgi:dihydrofolate reductase
MRKSIIVAASQNGVIGKDNQLPWRLPGDLRRFKALTMGHTLIMGRKTYESLPPKMRPLPGRKTVVLTRSSVGKFSFAADTFDGALESALRIETVERDGNYHDTSAEVFVCGGGEVYKEALPLVDRVYLTVVERDFEGDTSISIPFWSAEEIALDYQVGFAGATWCLTGLAVSPDELPTRFETWDRVR